MAIHFHFSFTVTNTWYSLSIVHIDGDFTVTGTVTVTVKPRALFSGLFTNYGYTHWSLSRRRAPQKSPSKFFSSKPRKQRLTVSLSPPLFTLVKTFASASDCERSSKKYSKLRRFIHVPTILVPPPSRKKSSKFQSHDQHKHQQLFTIYPQPVESPLLSFQFSPFFACVVVGNVPYLLLWI